MGNILKNIAMLRPFGKRKCIDCPMNLAQGKCNRDYIIKEIQTNDEELKHFLFTLGCYEGESVTVVSVLGQNYVLSVNDARYSVDKNLAEAIII